MKILIVHNPYKQLGGEDIVFQQESSILRDYGHQVFTYVRHNDEIAQYSGLGQIALVPRAIWATDSRRQFAALLEQQKPDIVHVHNTFVMISPSIFSVCHKLRIPVVHTLHNYRLLCAAGTFYRNGRVCEECVGQGLWSGIRHACYHNSRTVTAVVTGMIATHRALNTWTHPGHFYIALSEFARQKFLNSGLRSDRIFVKPNFVHPDPGSSTEKENYVLFVGRLSPEKRVNVLLDAWERSRQQFPLRIVGGGPERIELEQIAKRRGLKDIHFEGQLPRSKVIGVIAKARFMVFSSEWYENFPVSIAEAFAGGTPVICSRLGAMQEIVSDHRTGLHFTPGNADDLAAKMDWAWSNPDEIDALGKEARREFETKYSAEINYKQLINIYEQVVLQTRALNC